MTAKMKKIREAQLDILRVFKSFCEEHQLTYFLWSGTLLGAVRHQGFIPWDDDVDVAMPRKDYDRFLELAKAELPAPYALHTDENDPNALRGGMCRMRNSDTMGAEYWELDHCCNWGIWIDILALDDVYEDEGKRREQLRKIAIYKRLCLIQTYGEGRPEFQGLPAWKKYAYRMIIKIEGRRGLLASYRKACMACPAGESAYIRPFTASFDANNYQVFFKKDFETTAKLPFEDMELAVPAGYERLLGMTMGKYMEYPPEEQRHPRHTGVFDPETPYSVYQHRLLGTFNGIEGKVIVAFGAGNMFEDYMRRYGERYRPAYVVDNGYTKWGKPLHGIMVCGPDKLLEIPRERLRVIICNIYYREIAKQLEDMGIEDYYLHIENKYWLNDILFPSRLENAETKQNISGSGLIRQSLTIERGKEICPETGMIECADDSRATSFRLYHAFPGSVLQLLNADYRYGIATYSRPVDGTYIYTYCYQKEENWTTYNHDYRKEELRAGNYYFDDERYFRVCLKRADGAPVPEEAVENINNILAFSVPHTEHEEKKYFAEEIRDTATAVLKRKQAPKTLTLALVTDTHYVVGGTWEDTLQNLKAVHEQAGFDAVVHLGDLTDGMVPKAVTQEYVKKIKDDLKALGVPVYIVLGNHDSNYFYGNQEPLNDEEQYALYLEDLPADAVKSGKKHWYYTDRPELALRMLFLSSFDYREIVRYGFSEEEIAWVDKVLENTPNGYKILVFAHVPPLAEIHFWSDEIRNGERLMALLEAHHRRKRIQILAYIHGHNHGELIYEKREFPVISLGCNKCEYFTDKKPEGAVTYERKLDTVSQDLWDVLVLDGEGGRMDFIRFGAGEDKVINREAR